MIYKVSKYIFLAGIPAASAGISSHYITRNGDDKACERINTKLLEGNIALCDRLSKLETNPKVTDCTKINIQNLQINVLKETKK